MKDVSKKEAIGVGLGIGFGVLFLVLGLLIFMDKVLHWRKTAQMQKSVAAVGAKEKRVSASSLLSVVRYTKKAELPTDSERSELPSRDQPSELPPAGFASELPVEQMRFELPSNDQLVELPSTPVVASAKKKYLGA